MLSLLAVMTWGQGLAADARLAAPIQIVEYAAAAPRVCADLAKLTGTSITCDPALKDDLVVLVVKERPAKEIMAKLGATFNWDWVPDGAGYRLKPSRDFLDRASHGRDSILRRDGHLMQAEARRLLAEKKNGELAETDFSSRLVLTELAGLDDDSLTRLYDHRFVAASSPGPLETGFTDAAREIERHIIENGSGNPAFPEMPPAEEGSSKPASFSEILIQFKSVDTPSVVYLNSAGRGIPANGSYTFDLVKSPINPISNDFLSAALSTHPTDLDGLPSETSEGPSEPLEFYARWSAAIAKKLGVDLVGDAYDLDSELSTSTSDAQIKRLLKPTLESGWLTNRHPDWPRFRKEQLPRDILNFFAGHGTTDPLDTRAAVAARITEAQLNSPLLPLDRRTYWFYIVWNALPEGMKDALFAGKPLDFHDLPSPVIQALYELGDTVTARVTNSISWGGDGPFDEPEFRDYANIVSTFLPNSTPAKDAYVPKRPSPIQLTDFAHAYPYRLGKDAKIWAQTSSIPSVYDADSSTVCMPGALANSADGFGRATSLSDNLKLATTRAVRLHFVLEPGVEIQLDGSETTLGRSLKSDRTDWPADLVDRIDKRSAFNFWIVGQLSGLSAAPPP